MGFGILVAGYLFLLAIPLRSMGMCVEVLGYLLMLRALYLLSPYQKQFRWAKYAAWVLLPLGIFSLIRQGLSWIGMEDLYQTVKAATELPYSILTAVVLFVFHILLLAAVQAQAKDVELPDIMRQAMRNRIVTVMYFVLTVTVSFLNIPLITDKVPYGTLVGMVSLLGCAWILLNAKMLFNCYMWICLPGDEDMPLRDSKMPSIFRVQKPKEDTPEEAYQKQKDAYNEAMRRRQEARTKKKKRGRR